MQRWKEELSVHRHRHGYWTQGKYNFLFYFEISPKHIHFRENYITVMYMLMLFFLSFLR